MSLTQGDSSSDPEPQPADPTHIPQAHLPGPTRRPTSPSSAPPTHFRPGGAVTSPPPAPTPSLSGSPTPQRSQLPTAALPLAPPPTPTRRRARPQAAHLVHELPALLHHLLVHGARRVRAEVVVVVVRLEGVLHEPDQAARSRAPRAAAAGARALLHVAGHGQRRVGSPLGRERGNGAGREGGASPAATAGACCESEREAPSLRRAPARARASASAAGAARARAPETGKHGTPQRPPTRARAREHPRAQRLPESLDQVSAPTAPAPILWDGAWPPGAEPKGNSAPAPSAGQARNGRKEVGSKVEPAH